MEFPKKQFEERVHALVVTLMNEYFAIPGNDEDILNVTRQMLQALHSVIEEEVVQILYATKLRAQLKKGENTDDIL